MSIYEDPSGLPDNFTNALDNCPWKENLAVPELVIGRHTQQAFRDELLIKEYKDGSFCDFLGSFFGMEEFKNGQGGSLITEVYHRPNLQRGFQKWTQVNRKKNKAISDPSECLTCAEELPTGGYSTEDVEFFERHLKTQRYCVKNVREVRQFLRWMNMVTEDLLTFDEQIMQEFFIMVALRYAGNKILFEKDHPQIGTTANRRAIMANFPMSYMDKLLPAAVDTDNIVPFDLGMAQLLTYNMTYKKYTDAAVTKGRRGEPIYEFWTDGDWYLQNVLQDADYADKVKYTLPAQLFAGYSEDVPDREVFGNIAVRSMECMPRFADSTDGGITIVQEFVRDDVEIGQESIPNPDYDLAPYHAFLLPSPDQLRILKTEPITTSQGIEIRPIGGDKPWEARNLYDKDCNPNQNMPHWEREMEIGVAPYKPWQSVFGLARRRVFRHRPLNECDLVDNALCVTPDPNTCIAQGGCDNKKPVESSITRVDKGDEVLCTSTTCGDPLEHLVQVEFKPNRPCFTIDCPCGSTLRAFLSDGSQIDVTLIDDSFAHPQNIYYVRSAAPLPAGVCIVRLICGDATPTVANVLACKDSNDPGCETFADGEVLLVVDNFISCTTGGGVTVTFNDTTTAAATIVEDNSDSNQYKILFSNTALNCASNGGIATITCV